MNPLIPYPFQKLYDAATEARRLLRDFSGGSRWEEEDSEVAEHLNKALSVAGKSIDRIQKEAVEKGREALLKALKGKNREALLEDIGTFGGHDIICPDDLVKSGWPEEFVQCFVRVHESDFNDPKSTIFSEKGPMDEMVGVYELEFIRGIGRAVGADMREAMSKMGRGFQARLIGEAILKKLKETEAA